MTNWTDANEHDPGVTLVELLAYVGDALSCYQDQVAAESSARKRWRAVAFVTAGLGLWWCRRKAR